MSSRFMVARTIFRGENIPPHSAISKEAEGGQFTVSLNGDVLLIEEGGSTRFYAASLSPSSATGIGMTAVAMAQISFPDTSSRYVVIRRAETLSTFPGMLSFPGGFMDKWGDQFYGTAMRELEEETGGWCTHMAWSGIREIAVIDSVPRPDRHNITVVVGMDTTVTCTPEEIQTQFVPQPGEVSAVHIMTLEEMKERSAEFTPGIRKLLNDQ